MNNIQKIAIIVILLILIVGALLLNTQNYVPANEADVFTKNFKYSNGVLGSSGLEGFGSLKDSDKNVEYSSYTDNKAMDSYSRWEINPASNSCYRVSGTSGLVCSPSNEPSNPKDIYSEAKGSLDCKSYGLTNSKGFLCLNDQQEKLYMTRGGNASGGGGDIGLHSK